MRTKSRFRSYGPPRRPGSHPKYSDFCRHGVGEIHETDATVTERADVLALGRGAGHRVPVRIDHVEGLVDLAAFGYGAQARDRRRRDELRFVPPGFRPVGFLFRHGAVESEGALQHLVGECQHVGTEIRGPARPRAYRSPSGRFDELPRRLGVLVCASRFRAFRLERLEVVLERVAGDIEFRAPHIACEIGSQHLRRRVGIEPFPRALGDGLDLVMRGRDARPLAERPEDGAHLRRSTGEGTAVAMRPEDLLGFRVEDQHQRQHRLRKPGSLKFPIGFPRL